ncbi:MAG: hypothetical protein WBD50_00340 [Candidatus Rhabdochlamydia sp.]
MNLMQSTNTFEEFEKASKEYLQDLFNNREKLRRLIMQVPTNKQLFSLCEHYDILDKIILCTSDDLKVRLRLHIFGDGYFDRPHNHRWSYTSYILSGEYLHTIFNIQNESKEPSIENLYPVLIRQEKAGDLYTLHYSQYHSVIAQPDTITLIMRGPSEKERFRVIDRVTNESWWQYGVALESEEEKHKKQMTHKQFDEAVEKLIRIGVI